MVYVESDSAQDDDEDEDQLDAPDVLTFEDGVIDLGPELRDEILLAVPVRCCAARTAPACARSAAATATSAL